MAAKKAAIIDALHPPFAETNRIIESVCFEAIRKIVWLLEGEDIDDFECVEEIMNLFKETGITAHYRYDFGQ